MRTRTWAVMAAAAALAGLTACSGPGSADTEERLHVETDRASYSSAEGVSGAADIAVTGPVLGVRTRECDEGGDTATEPAVDPPAEDGVDPGPDPSATGSPAPTATPSGIAGDGAGGPECVPMVFLKVRVAAVVKPGFGISGGDEIVVGDIDTDKVTAEGTTPLVVGRRYALYLRRMTAPDHPGITSVPTFWIPVGGDQGVFFLNKDTVRPASADIVALTNAEAEKKLGAASGTSRPERLRTTVAGLREAAKVAAAGQRASAHRAAKQRRPSHTSGPPGRP
ncbi:hypothetical protein GT045_27925 [Streptomyces sp. SID486]|uniref:hypothetical protein n=1 Tax=Streptomyces sp. SID486 TaxID=2690264 RepID=UPI00136DD5EE|nr:hypothetical protein [Streptomyces sp. SID486]MYX98528.1 hypothetical protein [Streptomyces sp. SID486]